MIRRLEKLEDDHWMTKPPGVRSSFYLTSDSTHPGHGRDIVYTEACGFGWRFGVSQSHKSSNNVLNLFFDHHCTQTAELGQLMVSVIVENLVKLGDPAAQYTIPIPQRRWDGDYRLGSYFSSAGFVDSPIFIIDVLFSNNIGFFPNLPVPDTLHTSRSPVHNGMDLVDTRFHLFSRRSSGGRKTHPKAVYASSILLRGHTSYIDSLLFPSGFKQPQIIDINSNSSNSIPFSDENYDYDSDSDLDSESSLEDTTPSTAVDSISYREPRVLPGFTKSSAQGDSIMSDERKPQRLCKFIPIPDAAHQTWLALVVYLYTRKVQFLPLTSLNGRMAAERKNTFGACSPKSMYRLADKLGLEELQKLSLDAIRESLSSQNIMREVFCRFTSLYSEIQKLETDMFIHHFLSTSNDEFDRVWDELVEGYFPYSSGAFSIIIRALKMRVGTLGETQTSSQMKQIRCHEWIRSVQGPTAGILGPAIHPIRRVLTPASSLGSRSIRGSDQTSNSSHLSQELEFSYVMLPASGPMLGYNLPPGRPVSWEVISRAQSTTTTDSEFFPPIMTRPYVVRREKEGRLVKLRQKLSRAGKRLLHNR